jgi:flagellar FliL protein
MAQNQDAALDTGGIAEAPAKKKSSFMKVVVFLLLAAGLAGGGLYGYTHYLNGELPAGLSELVAGKEKPVPVLLQAPSVMYALKPLMVNLAESRGSKVLKVSVAFELSSPDLSAELDEKLQKVTDSILVLLSSKTFDDVYSVEGKFRLKDEITMRVNRFLLMGHVRDAYFTEFVIQ